MSESMTSRMAQIFVGMVFATVAEPIGAQDRVVIQQPGGSRFPISGYIEDYTGREIVLRAKPSESVRRYPRSDVVEVTTEYTPHHDRGVKLFADKKIAEADEEFRLAINEEDRPWVQREILASQIRCALWTGDYHRAIIRFLKIVQTDPETQHYSLIPLNWTGERPAEKLLTDAEIWMSLTSSPVSRLVGASWLLAIVEHQAEAEKTLRKLAREPDVRVQRLAQMQLWRLKLGGATPLEPEVIQKWQKFLEELPVELRGGAYFVIGQAWIERREFERAARALVWIPFVYDPNRWLSSRACFEAAESLNQLDDQTQAINLYSEVVFRYGDTPWGPKAEVAWNRLRGAKSPAPSSKN